MRITNLRLEGFRISYDIYYMNHKNYHIEYLAISHLCINRIDISKKYYLLDKENIYYDSLKQLKDD